MRALILISILLTFSFTAKEGAAARLGNTAAAKNSNEQEFKQREVLGKKRAIDIAGRNYAETVEKILNKSVSVQKYAKVLRNNYQNTMDYEPFAQSIISKLTEYAYIVDTSEDSTAVRIAQKSYNSLLYKHLGNFDVVGFALDMSRLDVRFGNEIMLRDLYRVYITNLKRDIRLEKGKNPDYAFNIITYGEENFILGEIGGVVQKSEIYKVNRKTYYNVHDLIDGNGEFRQIFFNVSEPIVGLNLINLIREHDKAFTIPAQ